MVTIVYSSYPSAHGTSKVALVAIVGGTVYIYGLAIGRLSIRFLCTVIIPAGFLFCPRRNKFRRGL